MASSKTLADVVASLKTALDSVGSLGEDDLLELQAIQQKLSDAKHKSDLEKTNADASVWAPANKDFVTFCLFTNGGMEDLVADEVSEMFGKEANEFVRTVCPLSMDGVVRFDVPLSLQERFRKESLLLRSIHDVTLFHHQFAITPQDQDPSLRDPIKQISEMLSSEAVAVPTLVGAKSFRVSCERVGDHGFPSTAVEVDAGEALHERFGVPGRMKGFEVRVRVDIIGSKVLIGTQLNELALSRRHKLVFTRTVTLKPNVAYAMLRLAGWQPGQSLLDPCCGSGTIVLEAAQIAKERGAGSAGAGGAGGDAGGSKPRLVGCDRSEASVKGAQDNAAAGELGDLVEFRAANARGLDRMFSSGEFDCVVTNLPWGIRVAKDADLDRIYKGMLYACGAVIRPGGILCVIVLRQELMLDLVRTTGLFRFLHLRLVQTGDMHPAVMVLQRRHEDAEKVQLKSALAAQNAASAAVRSTAATLRMDPSRVGYDMKKGAAAAASKAASVVTTVEENGEVEGDGGGQGAGAGVDKPASG